MTRQSRGNTAATVAVAAAAAAAATVAATLAVAARIREAGAFRSKLGSDVSSNTVWQKLNATFLKNETLIKDTGAALNAASNREEYIAAVAAAEGLKPVEDGYRFLVSKADGSVTYDSSKGIKNTYNNANNKAINENHNTRMSMMSAQLSINGMGNEIKQSTSTGQVEAYQAQTIVNSYGDNQGTVRLSRKA